jgi:hypothetical protein
MRTRTLLLPALALVGALTLAGCSSPSTVTEPDEATASTPAEVAETPAAAPAAEVGTRENPAPIGATVTGDEWTVVINSVTLGAPAADAVAGANQFNDAADPGTEFIVVNYTATYTGTDADGSMPALVGVEYVTGAGQTVSGLDKIVVAPEPAIDTVSTLYSGASATGNTAIQVPSPVDGVIAVRPGMLGDKVFVAVQ